MLRAGTFLSDSSHPPLKGAFPLGLGLLFSFFLIAFFLFSRSHVQCPPVLSPQTIRKEELFKNTSPYQISLGLKAYEAPLLHLPDLRQDLFFSFDPPRPVGRRGTRRLLVRLSESRKSQRVSLPCRIDLQFEQGLLCFSKSPSLFWLELQETSLGQIEAAVKISYPDEPKIESTSFLIHPQEAPLQEATDFCELSSFRKLAQAKWWGKDVLKEDSGERVEIEELLELKKNDWLVFQEGRWVLSDRPDETAPIAHLESVDQTHLTLEGWENENYIRFSIRKAPFSPFRIRPEDLFQSVRVRSKKQMSCSLEKQCLVLKTGDWVLKREGKWKILRSKEAKDLFLKEKTLGEIFVFEGISENQGQKIIQGAWINPERTQKYPLQLLTKSRQRPHSAGVKS